MFYKKTNLDQIITFKTPKLGPDNNSTADECANDGFMELTLDATEVDDVRCILILDVQLDVVSV